MKKLSLLFVFVVFFISISPIFSLAATNPAPVANSDLQEPVPYVIQSGDIDITTLYFVTYKSDYKLYEVVLYIPHGETVYANIKDSYPGFSFTSDVDFTYYSRNVYNALTGQFLEGNIFNRSSNNNIITFLGAGLIPNNGNYCTDCFIILPDNVILNNQNSNYFSINNQSFINWFIPHDNNVLRSTIPQPLSDLRHMYFADHLYLYQLNIDYPVLYSSVGLTANNLTSSEFFDQCFIELQKANSDTVNIRIVNNSEYSFNVYLSIYDVITGEFISTTSFPISPIQPSGDPFIATFGQRLNDPVTHGIWYTGFINTDGLSNFDKLQISWSDTIDYSQDFIIIRNLLDQIYNSVDYLETKLDNLFTLLTDNWSWFKTLYFNTILQKWSITENQLDQIIEALVGSGQETTYPPDEVASSEMDNYVSQEDQFFNNFDSAGSQIDSVFDEAVSAFQDNSNGFAFIKMLMDTFIFSIPSSYIIVFISLSFGLVILFLGRAITKR